MRPWRAHLPRKELRGDHLSSNVQKSSTKEELEEEAIEKGHDVALLKPTQPESRANFSLKTAGNEVCWLRKWLCESYAEATQNLRRISGIRNAQNTHVHKQTSHTLMRQDSANILAWLKFPLPKRKCLYELKQD